MSWIMRVSLFVFGLVVIGAAKYQLESGRWVFIDASYHQTTFAAGAVGVGLVLCALAFLPRGAWVYRHITTRRNSRSRRKS